MGILEEVRAGKPISVPVIDAHTHLYETSSGGLHQGFHSAADTVKLMDRIGIDAIVTSPIIMGTGNVALANKQADEAARQFPGRIYGLLTIAPHDGVEGVKKEIARYCNNERFVGMKMLIGYHGAVTREEYAPAFSFAQECGCPVTLHCWAGSMTDGQVAQILDRYPKVKIVLAHLGGGVRDMTVRMAKLVNQCDRLYLDSCGSHWNRLGMDEVVGLIGDERLCYGSDMIYHDPRGEIGRVVFSGMPEESMKKIFADNYLCLLKSSQYGQIKLS